MTSLVEETVFKKRVVSNDELVATLAQQDVQNLVKAELLHYRHQLNEDDLERCGKHAVWHCLEGHNPNHPSGQKFTTSLWQFIHWECLKALRSQTRSRKGQVQLPEGDEALSRATRPAELRGITPGGLGHDGRERIEHVREHMKFLPRRVRVLLTRHYEEGRTLEEVGKLGGYSKETARTKHDWAIARLRELCEDDFAECEIDEDELPV